MTLHRNWPRVDNNQAEWEEIIICNGKFFLIYYDRAEKKYTEKRVEGAGELQGGHWGRDVMKKYCIK